MYHGERFNSYTHLFGAVAALGGLIALVYIALEQGDLWKTVSFSLYGASLFLLYLSSTLYHSTQHKRLKRFFQKLDHFSIYLLIAGSYTPLTLVTLDSSWGIPLFIIIWMLAMIGIVVDAYSRDECRVWPVTIYLVMGWLVLVAIYPLYQALPGAGMFWLVCGGIFYTVGLIFYFKEDEIKHGHGIWHMFVLAGSTSHFVVVAGYVA